MNQFFIETVIQDREREVAKYAKYNQIERDAQDSVENQPESIERGKYEVILGIAVVAKRLRHILAIKKDDRIKA